MTAFNAHNSNALPYDILTPERPRRSATKMRTRTEDAIVDAEFVTVDETAPRVRPGNDNRTRARQHRSTSFLSVLNGLADALEMRLARLSADHFSALVAAAVVGVFVTAGGLKAIIPDAAPATATAPLSISHISLTPQDANGMKLMLVSGIIENNTDGDMALQPIRADFINSGLLVRSVVIDPPVARIKAGESRGFSARLSHPGGKLPDVKLSFNTQDVPGA